MANKAGKGLYEISKDINKSLGKDKDNGWGEFLVILIFGIILALGILGPIFFAILTLD